VHISAELWRSVFSICAARSAHVARARQQVLVLAHRTGELVKAQQHRHDADVHALEHRPHALGDKRRRRMRLVVLARGDALGRRRLLGELRDAHGAPRVAAAARRARQPLGERAAVDADARHVVGDAHRRRAARQVRQIDRVALLGRARHRQREPHQHRAQIDHHRVARHALRVDVLALVRARNVERQRVADPVEQRLPVVHGAQLEHLRERADRRVPRLAQRLGDGVDFDLRAERNRLERLRQHGARVGQRREAEQRRQRRRRLEHAAVHVLGGDARVACVQAPVGERHKVLQCARQPQQRVQRAHRRLKVAHQRLAAHGAGQRQNERTEDGGVVRLVDARHRRRQKVGVQRVLGARRARERRQQRQRRRLDVRFIGGEAVHQADGNERLDSGTRRLDALRAVPLAHVGRGGGACKRGKHRRQALERDAIGERRVGVRSGIREATGANRAAQHVVHEPIDGRVGEWRRSQLHDNIASNRAQTTLMSTTTQSQPQRQEPERQIAQGWRAWRARRVRARSIEHWQQEKMMEKQ
jgi:hypothetical protein